MLTNSIQKYFIEETRLGIPVFYHEEALHGHAAKGSTSYPQPIGLAATFNPAVIEQVFSVVAKEARLRGTHQVLAPVVDPAAARRDHRIAGSGQQQECGLIHRPLGRRLAAAFFGVMKTRRVEVGLVPLGTVAFGAADPAAAVTSSRRLSVLSASLFSSRAVDTVAAWVFGAVVVGAAVFAAVAEGSAGSSSHQVLVDGGELAGARGLVPARGRDLPPTLFVTICTACVLPRVGNAGYRAS